MGPICLQFHDVVGIRLEVVRHFPGGEYAGEFWCRDLVLTGEGGREQRLELFSYVAGGLLTPEEKAEEAMVCAMAEDAEGTALNPADDNDVPF